MVSNIHHLSYHDLELLAQPPLILIVQFRHCQQHIPDKNHDAMCSQAIMRNTKCWRNFQKLDHNRILLPANLKSTFTYNSPPVFLVAGGAIFSKSLDVSRE